MRDGDEVRLIGSAGAPFMVIVGQPFTQAEIQRRLDSGEWSWPGDAPPPSPGPDTDEPPTEDTATDEAAAEAEPDPDRPALSAPKADWVVYVARTQHMSREDAANYTKADLIDMVS
ncbi:hypothetical protein OG331_23060 [Streptomyces sp. NBC_01017]|uniref:hypothetical protein n=1 Tax=Streptomyces sp. NBC_01017 TaxID=2903721 RepID=UPI00386C25E4|nr:hypothetical protein OG331_23060 [Streptomyces sp. NBC_01017]